MIRRIHIQDFNVSFYLREMSSFLSGNPAGFEFHFDVKIAAPAFVHLVSAWYVFISFFTFNLCLSI